MHVWRNVLEELADLSLAHDLSKSREALQPSTLLSCRSVTEALKRFAFHPLMVDWIKIQKKYQFECFCLALRVISSCIGYFTSSAPRSASTLITFKELLLHLTAMEDSASLFQCATNAYSLALVRQHMSELRESLINHRLMELSQKRENISRWLSTPNFPRRKRLLLDHSVPGSCSWILSEPSFLEWFTTSNTVLHVQSPRPPDIAKSVAAAFMAGYLDKAFGSSTGKPIVVYGNHPRMESHDHLRDFNLVGFLGGLLTQIWWEHQDLDLEIADNITEFCERHATEQSRPTPKQLQMQPRNFLIEVDNAFIIIDELDEVDYDSHIEMLQCIADLRGTANVLIFSQYTMTDTKKQKEYLSGSNAVWVVDTEDYEGFQQVYTELERLQTLKALDSSFDER